MKLFFLSILMSVSLTTNAQTTGSRNTTEEAAIKSMINNFLVAIGNYDIEAMKPMLAEKCNVHGAILRDGKWTTYSLTIEEFLSILKSEKTPTKYTEVINNWDVRIEHDQMAFVRGEATLQFESKQQSHNIDYFTLIKENGVWKIFNGTYVGVRD